MFMGRHIICASILPCFAGRAIVIMGRIGSNKAMYHYTDSGLSNVWLVNGYRRHRTAYGPGVSIDALKALHRAIGLWIVQKPKPLTGAELSFLRQELDLSQKRLAEIVGETAPTVSLWERRGRIPKLADRTLRALYRETVGGNPRIRDIVQQLTEKNVKEHERVTRREACRPMKARAERATFAMRVKQWWTAG
jgi:DNA-binding transcriptional regulator YiaG